MKNTTDRNTDNITNKNNKLIHNLEISIFILGTLTIAITLITELLFDLNQTRSIWLLFFTLLFINIYACLKWYRYYLKNNIQKQEYMIIIFFVLFLLGSILLCTNLYPKTEISIYKYIFINIVILIQSIYYWKYWTKPIILNLWILITIIIFLSIGLFYILKSYIHFYKSTNEFIDNLKNKEFIEFKNFKWQIAKNQFDRIIIDSLPYCMICGKRLSYGDNRNYLHCFDCQKTYKFDEINELCINVKKFIKDKYKLDYLPELIQ